MTSNINAFVALSITVAVSGCGPTVAQQRVTSIQTNVPAIGRAYDMCRAEVRANPDLAEIAARLAANTAEPTLVQITDKTVVQPNQRGLLVRYYEGIDACYEPFVRALASVLPEQNDVQSETRGRATVIRARLLAGDISWGEANMRNMEVVADHKVRAQMAGRGLDANLQMQHAAEMQNRAVTAAAVAGAVAGAADAAASRPVYRPVIINNYRR